MVLAGIESSVERLGMGVCVVLTGRWGQDRALGGGRAEIGLLGEDEGIGQGEEVEADAS